MPWWGWILVGVIFLSSELFLATDFFLFFFGAMGLVMALAVLAGVTWPLWVQLLVYTTLSIILLLLFRRKIRGMFDKPDADVRDSEIGKPAIAEQSIAPETVGKVSLRGSIWQAHNIGSDTIEAGAYCRVERVEGVKLFVRSDPDAVNG